MRTSARRYCSEIRCLPGAGRAALDCAVAHDLCGTSRGAALDVLLPVRVARLLDDNSLPYSNLGGRFRELHGGVPRAFGRRLAVRSAGFAGGFSPAEPALLAKLQRGRDCSDRGFGLAVRAAEPRRVSPGKASRAERLAGSDFRFGFSAGLERSGKSRRSALAVRRRVLPDLRVRLPDDRRAGTRAMELSRGCDPGEPGVARACIVRQADARMHFQSRKAGVRECRLPDACNEPEEPWLRSGSNPRNVASFSALARGISRGSPKTGSGGSRISRRGTEGFP